MIKKRDENSNDNRKIGDIPYDEFLDIMKAGLIEGITSAVEDHKDQNGVWRNAKDAWDYTEKLNAKRLRERQRQPE